MSGPEAPRRPAVHVEVDHLVLHGFAPADRRRVSEEIADALSAGLATWSTARSGRAEHLDVGSFEMVPGGSASPAGGLVADGVKRTVS